MAIQIGISPRLLDHPPEGSGLADKRIQILSSSMAEWVASCGAVALMIPHVGARAPGLHLPLQEVIAGLDGLLLQGGADISPSTYGATPLDGPSNSNLTRDEFELALVHEFLHARKPVLGICRGAQLLNVYFGGTLLQDIPSQHPGATTHRDLLRYDKLTHEVDFLAGSWLESIYGTGPHRVVSIHHQCIAKLGRGLMLEARSSADDLPAGIRHPGFPFVVGVQWHPEYHAARDNDDPTLLDSVPLMQAFLDAARKSRHAPLLPGRARADGPHAAPAA